VFLAAMALGRMSLVSVRDARIARRHSLEDDDTDPADRPGESTTTGVTGRRVRQDSDAT